MWAISFWTLSGFMLLFTIMATVYSLLEREKRAALILLTVSFGLCLLSLVLNSLFQQGDSQLGYICYSSLVLLAAVILFGPWKLAAFPRGQKNLYRVDERNIMFSRAELTPGSERFSQYYAEFPEHFESDESFRKLPGLLSEKSTFYHPWLFPAADAAFYTVEALHTRVDGPVSAQKEAHQPVPLTRFLKQWAAEMGVHSIGITEVNSSHIYTKGGRKHNYNQNTHLDHPVALVFTVEMNYDRVSGAPRAPIILESSNQYLQLFCGILVIRQGRILMAIIR